MWRKGFRFVALNMQLGGDLVTNPSHDTDPTTPYVTVTAVCFGALLSYALLNPAIWGDLSLEPFRQGATFLAIAPTWALLAARASKKPLRHLGFTLAWDWAATRGLVLLLPVILYNVWNVTLRGIAVAASAQSPTLSGTLGVAFGTGLVPPLAEELLFRGYALTVLLDGAYAPKRFLGLTSVSWYISVIFLLPHLITVVPGYLFVNLGRFYAGLVYAWIFERTRSLTGPIAAHFLVNLPTALVALVPLLLR